MPPNRENEKVFEFESSFKNSKEPSFKQPMTEKIILTNLNDYLAKSDQSERDPF